jgi:hypothetical protein
MEYRHCDTKFSKDYFLQGCGFGSGSGFDPDPGARKMRKKCTFFNFFSIFVTTVKEEIVSANYKYFDFYVDFNNFEKKFVFKFSFVDPDLHRAGFKYFVDPD